MKKRVWSMVLVCLVLAGLSSVAVEAKTGSLELIGIPADVQGGRYDHETGIFYADVVGRDDALVRVSYDDMEISGQQLEWHTEDDYFIFTNGAVLDKEDLNVVSNTLEYFSEDERLEAAGEVKVVTTDATIYADHMIYYEAEDEALFTGNVIVELDDGVLKGQRLVIHVESQAMQFFGVFQGEFSTTSSTTSN